MRLVHIAERERRGFTLVELLVVVAIIGVLVSLLLSAVMKAVSQADVAKTRSDISQIAQAIAAFGVKFEVQGPFPSKLMLCEDFTDYAKDGSRLATDSASFLQRVWPRITTNASGTTMWAAGKIDWSGTGVNNNSHRMFILQGQECLVFFLGGIPTGQGTNVPGCTGFSTSPTNPATPGGTRIAPFFTFDSSRLKPGQSTLFYQYLDPYAKAPYAYFSSYKTPNGYNRYLADPLPYGRASDCAALNLWPYAEAPYPAAPQFRYMNPNTFQIIAAGRDGGFGTGTNPIKGTPLFQKGTPMYALGDSGYDDMSNFHDKFLGIPPD
jgi:prepilin-type N-terminal cleavage/methylation domain-containing protein